MGEAVTSIVPLYGKCSRQAPMGGKAFWAVAAVQKRSKKGIHLTLQMYYIAFKDYVRIVGFA